MKHFALGSLLMILAIGFAACDEDMVEPDPDPEPFKNTFAFTIDGTAYSYDTFEIMHDTVQNGPRLFIRKEDGNDIFTFNFLLDWAEGTHGMNWNDGSSFFFARIPQGDFWTLDPAKCPLTIVRNDKNERQIEATFAAIGEQAQTNETISVTEGVLKVEY